MRKTIRFSLLIKERCEAYIEAAAQEMGLEVHTRVALQESEEGIPQPSEVWLDIPYHASLSARRLHKSLGLPSNTRAGVPRKRGEKPFWTKRYRRWQNRWS